MKKNCNNCKNLDKISNRPSIVATGEGECSILYKILCTEKRIFVRKEYLDRFCCNFYQKKDEK